MILPHIEPLPCDVVMLGSDNVHHTKLWDEYYVDKGDYYQVQFRLKRKGDASWGISFNIDGKLKQYYRLDNGRPEIFGSFRVYKGQRWQLSQVPSNTDGQPKVPTYKYTIFGCEQNNSN